MKDLLGLEYLSREQIENILEITKPMKSLFMRSIKKVPTLRGKTVALLFYEPSTRTRISFELAAKRLSADTINIASQTSSAKKGESLLDTGKTLEAMKVDFVVMRHYSSGAAQLLSRRIGAHVINAGDGSHEHPTQGLLDVFTLLEKKGRIEGLKIAIIGDIIHSRVARSNLWALTKLGANVVVCAPPTLLAQGITDIFGPKVSTTFHIEEALKDCDAVNVLRLQLERQKENLFPSLREYTELYCLDMKRLSLAKPGCLVLHPGPMNRGIEITAEVADSKQSVILDQVTNGIAVRMAVLYWLTSSRPVPVEVAAKQTMSKELPLVESI